VNETTENIGARRLHTIMGARAGRDQLPAPELFKSPRSEASQEGVIAEVGASDSLTGEHRSPRRRCRDRAEEGRWDGGEGDRGRTGVRAAAGGVDVKTDLSGIFCNLMKQIKARLLWAALFIFACDDYEAEGFGFQVGTKGGGRRR